MEGRRVEGGGAEVEVEGRARLDAGMDFGLAHSGYGGLSVAPRLNLTTPDPAPTQPRTQPRTQPSTPGHTPARAQPAARCGWRPARAVEPAPPDFERSGEGRRAPLGLAKAAVVVDGAQRSVARYPDAGYINAACGRGRGGVRAPHRLWALAPLQVR